MGQATMHFDGASWSVVSTGFDAQAVSCAAAADCWAVGTVPVYSGNALLDETLMEHWDGTRWMAAGSSVSKSRLEGIACTGEDDCWAVGANTSFTMIDDTPGPTASTSATPSSAG